MWQAVFILKYEVLKCVANHNLLTEQCNMNYNGDVVRCPYCKYSLHLLLLFLLFLLLFIYYTTLPSIKLKLK